MSFERFCDDLLKHDLQVTSGGRFVHVMGKTDKGRAMLWLLDYLNEAEPNVQWTVIALGDSANDKPMLELADHAVVVKNRGGSMQLARTNNVIYTEEPGPAGWQIAIDDLLDRLGG